MMKDSKFDKIERMVNEVHRLLTDLIYDTKRGQWGTSCESALSAAEVDLVDVAVQLELVRQIRRPGSKLPSLQTGSEVKNG